MQCINEILTPNINLLYKVMGDHVMAYPVQLFNIITLSLVLE